MSNEAIISKIQKLLAYDGDNATEAEVANAMNAAQRLMEKYAIETADLEEDASYGNDVERTRAVSELSARLGTWESWLRSAVEYAVPGVNSYRTNEYRKPKFGEGSARTRKIAVFMWYGPADLVEVAKNLFDETRAVIATMAHASYGGVYRGEGRSYAEGFARKLNELAKEARGGGSDEDRERLGEIVLASEAANLGWLEEVHGIKLQKAGGLGNGRHHSGAFGAGQRDGENHNFRPSAPAKKLSGRKLIGG